MLTISKQSRSILHVLAHLQCKWHECLPTGVIILSQWLINMPKNLYKRRRKPWEDSNHWLQNTSVILKIIHTHLNVFKFIISFDTSHRKRWYTITRSRHWCIIMTHKGLAVWWLWWWWWWWCVCVWGGGEGGLAFQWLTRVYNYISALHFG